MKIKLIITPSELHPVDGIPYAFTSTEKTPIETEIEISNKDIEDECTYTIDGSELYLDNLMERVYELIDDAIANRETELGLKYDKLNTYEWDFVDGNAVAEEVKAIAQAWCDREFLEFIKDADNLVDYHCENVKFSHVDGNKVYYIVEVEPFRVLD